jgi:hypothetical protein
LTSSSVLPQFFSQKSTFFFEGKQKKKRDEEKPIFLMHGRNQFF